MDLFSLDLAKLFALEMSLTESLIRGVVLYFVILFVLRLLPRRTTGELGAMDLVFILLLTESASHALGDFQSVGDGLVLLLVFILCNYGVNQLTYHSAFFQKLFEHDPIPIVRDGQLLPRAMRRELLSKDELLANLRENGIKDLSQVKKAFVESEGQISFIKYDSEEKNSKKQKKKST